VTASPRPVPLDVVPDGIPVDLVAADQFVVWKYVAKDGVWTKPPFVASHPARLASSTDPKTWRPYSIALGTYQDGKCDGIGVPMGDGRAGVDLDHCIDGDGVIAPWAQAIVTALHSYTERSPSGHGLRVFLRGTLPAGRRKAGDVEMYDGGRYLTVTGHHVPGTPSTIEERTAELHTLHAQTFPTKGNGHTTTTSTPRPSTPLDLGDSELLERARAASNGSKFSSLWSGDLSGHGSHSEADLALCNLLAFWTGADAGRVDRLFRQSALMRDKWDTRHGAQTYGDITVDKAIAGCRETYSGGWRRAAESSSPTGAVEADPHDADRAPEGERLILDPSDPLPSAKAFLSARHTADGHVALHHQGGAFLAFDPAVNAYHDHDESTVRSDMYRMLERCLRLSEPKPGQSPKLGPFKPNKGKVEYVLDALRALTNLASSAAAPCWLRDDPGLDPCDILACRSGLLHIPTRTLLPATPAFFTLQGLNFAFDPEAPAPEAWLQFLHDLWADDADSPATLQEAFGYNLTPRTHLQKVLMLVGPKRSGKGTIARVMRLLLGERNCCGPTLAGLADQFGLSVLIGKSLAVISDARIGGRTDTAVLTERLLSISGEDALSIPRKFLPDWTGKLSTRFWLLTTDPREAGR